MNMLQEFPQLIAVADYAGQRHAGQTRADKSTPYITHPVAVVQMLYNDFAIRDVTTLAAALLHDVLEDTPTTRLDLITDLSHLQPDGVLLLDVAMIVGYVDALTKEPAGLENPDVRAARFLRGYRKLIEAPTGVRLVKIADRLHNLQTAFTCKSPLGRTCAARYLPDTALMIGCLSRAARTIVDVAAVDALKREYWRCVLDFTLPEEK